MNGLRKNILVLKNTRVGITDFRKTLPRKTSSPGKFPSIKFPPGAFPPSKKKNLTEKT